MFHEHHSRSFYKSLTWTVTAFIITFTIIYLMTKDIKTATADALLIQVIKFFFFYLHERIWNKSNYGQSLKIKPDGTN